MQAFGILLIVLREAKTLLSPTHHNALLSNELSKA